MKIIKLRNISFGDMDFEILKAAMLASKSTMLKGDDVTTEKMPGKMLPGGGNNPNQLGFLTVYVLFEIFGYLFTVSPISTRVLNTYDT